MKKLSVIVPVYNKKDYVEECIKSIFSGGNGVEIILVDDGSTDGSEKIVDQYAANDNVTVIHQRNGGVSSARNAGLKRATGDYITFVDADDEVVQGSFTKVIPYLDGNDDICIASSIKEEENATVPLFTDMVFEGNDADVALKFILTGGTKEHRIPDKATRFMSGCKEKFYKKTFLDFHRMNFDETLDRNEDVLWSFHCYYYAKRIHFLPVTVYIDKEDPNGITKGMDIKKIVDNATLFIDKFNHFFMEKLDSQILGNFYFHQTLSVNYEAYRALYLKRISKSQFREIMKKWYALESNQFMLKELKGSELSIFKRIAFCLMKLRLYAWIGFEMSIHHKYR